MSFYELYAYLCFAHKKSKLYFTPKKIKFYYLEDGIAPMRMDGINMFGEI
jgi:hypothetical protein